MPVTRTWADLDLDFSIHPNTKTLSIKKDDAAIVRSIRYLLLTNHYERPFNPELGSHLSARLFDPMSHATTMRIKEDIESTINNFEPRVDLTEVIVEAKEQENGYLIYIRFFIIGEDVERQTTFFLERSR